MKSKGPKHRCIRCDGTRGKFTTIYARKYSVSIHVKCIAPETALGEMVDGILEEKKGHVSKS